MPKLASLGWGAQRIANGWGAAATPFGHTCASHYRFNDMPSRKLALPTDARFSLPMTTAPMHVKMTCMGIALCNGSAS